MALATGPSGKTTTGEDPCSDGTHSSSVAGFSAAGRYLANAGTPSALSKQPESTRQSRSGQCAESSGPARKAALGPGIQQSPGVISGATHSISRSSLYPPSRSTDAARPATVSGWPPFHPAPLHGRGKRTAG